VQTKNAPSAKDALNVGFAEIDITPPVGIGLAGYASRTGPSKAIGQPLYSKAMVLGCGNTTVAIAANDLLFITASLARSVRELVQQRVNVPPEHVLLSATHSHSGPLLEHMSMVEEEIVDEKWINEVLMQKMADVICLAHGNMQPATIGVGKSEIHGLTFNRRLRRKDGTVQAVHDLFRKDGAAPLEDLEFGPIDPDLGVLSVYDASKELLGLVVNFSCHPVCNDFDPQTIAADFPGFLTRAIEDSTGTTCLFTTAPSAEVNPAVRNSFHMKAVLSKQTLKLLDAIEPSDSQDIWARRRKIRLPLKKLPTIEEARQQFERDVAAESSGRFLARRRLMYAEQYEGQTHLETEVQVIGIGDMVFIGLPGEVSVEIGLSIKSKIASQSGKRNVFLITQANDWTGETIPDKAYEEGGSEPTTTRLGPGSEGVVVGNVMELLREQRE